MANTYPLPEAIRLWLLKDKIEAEGRTQAKVARAVGVSQQLFHNWLTGHSKVPSDCLNDIAHYFGFADDAALLQEIRRRYPAPPTPRQRRNPATPRQRRTAA